MRKQNEQYEELEPGQKYFYHLNANIIINCCYILVIMLNCSHILQAISSLNIVFPSIMITLTIALQLSYIRSQLKEANTIKIIKNPIVLCIGFFGLLMALQVPYYSLVVPIIVAITLCEQTLAFTRKQRIMKKQVILFGFLLFFAFLFLSHQKLLNINQNYFIGLVLALSIVSLLWFNTSVFSMLNKNIRKQAIYTGYLRYCLYPIQVNGLGLNLILYLAKQFIPEDYFLTLIKLSTILFCILLVFMVTFLEQVVIFSFYLKYQVRQTVFRVQNLRFVEYYVQGKCQKELFELQNDCLLCESKAKVIQLPCGHLYLCEACHRKKVEKQYFFCIFCKKMNNRMYRILNDEHLNKKRGYKKKFFIQKKLHKNQFLAV